MWFSVHTKLAACATAAAADFGNAAAAVAAFAAAITAWLCDGLALFGAGSSVEPEEATPGLVAAFAAAVPTSLLACDGFGADFPGAHAGTVVVLGKAALVLACAFDVVPVPAPAFAVACTPTQGARVPQGSQTKPYPHR